VAKKFAPALAAGAGLLGGVAQAATYDWTFTGTGGSPSGSGQYEESGGIVTAVSGTFEGIAITGVLAPGYLGGSQDNKFPGGVFAFSLASATGGGWDNSALTDCGSGAALWQGFNGTNFVNGAANFGAYTVTLAAVPEPASAALLGVAIAGFLAANRRRARPLSPPA
jgi:hypothetical protein